MASAFVNMDHATRLVAGLLGGSLALTTHGAKATARLAVNSSPEPFSNIVLSLIEDVVAVFLLGLAATHPWLAALLLTLLLLVCLLIIRTLFKFTRLLLGRLRGWFGGKPAASSLLK
jgi:hypothetical protein